MKSLWNDAEAAQFGGPLGPRVYTSRLLGRDRSLVLHGGGNTSVKIEEKDILGRREAILYVKGSGWDLEHIEAAGFSPVQLPHLLRLAQCETLSDPEMVNQLDTHMTRVSAPAPSVETNPKARVYVYRYSGFVGCGMKFSVWCDEVLLAKLTCGKYFIAELQPGPHTFRSDIESVTVSLEFEAGKSYFLRTDQAPSEGLARGELHVAADSEGHRFVQSLLPLPRKYILDDTMGITQ
jgi:hypothetical protein